MGNIVQDVQPTDALLLQQVYRMGAAFLEHGRQEVAAVDGALPRSLPLQDRTFEHALEGCRIVWPGCSPPREGLDTFGHELFKLVLEHGDIATAMANHGAASFFI